jgi:hypothetical protein
MVSIFMNELTIGFLQVKPDGQLLGSLSRHPHVHAHDPISISFDKTGTKLIFLDHHVIVP